MFKEEKSLHVGMEEAGSGVGQLPEYTRKRLLTLQTACAWLAIRAKADKAESLSLRTKAFYVLPPTGGRVR